MMSDHLKLVQQPAKRICPLCHELHRVNPYMVEIACDVRGVDYFDVVDIAYDAAQLGKRLGYPPCWFHQEGSRPEPMPWAQTCKHEGNFIIEICPHCGRNLDSVLYVYCPHCGNALPTSTPQESEDE